MCVNNKYKNLPKYEKQRLVEYRKKNFNMIKKASL